ncbi:MAG: rod shape-determining protein MreC [Myxococcaceae bacterium]
MLSLFKRYRELIVVGVLLVYPLGRFLATGRGARELNFIDRIVMYLSTPVQRALCWGVDGVTDTWTNYAWLRNVRQQNEALSSENAKLRESVTGLAETKAENDRLKKLLNFAESTPGTEIPAKIVGVNPVSQVLSVRINRGENDGVTKGMPVVTADGVVGQVIRASASAADVLLLTDANSRIGVRNQRSRARAIAHGAGEKFVNLSFEYALRTDDLEEGDAIITSGTDGIFPAGLMVGRLTAIQRKTSGPLQGAEIIPAVDVNRVEEVFVLSVAAMSPAPETAPMAVQPQKTETRLR